jgi:biopolymer transport protein ExbD
MPLKTTADESPTVNLTSMIDVLFLLIIFFMTGTKFAEMERKIGLKVPQIKNGQTLGAVSDRVSVSVYRDGSIKLDRDFVSLDELQVRLRDIVRRNPGLSVIVRGDAEGTLQNVANVLGVCRQAGVTDMGISVRLANQPTNSNSLR